MRFDRHSEFTTLPHNTLVYGKNADNGWYFVLRMRSIKAIKEIFDPYFFRAHRIQSYKIVGCIFRKRCGHNHYSATYINIWAPRDDWSSVKDRYLTWSRAR